VLEPTYLVQWMRAAGQLGPGALGAVCDRYSSVDGGGAGHACGQPLTADRPLLSVRWPAKAPTAPQRRRIACSRAGSRNSGPVDNLNSELLPYTPTATDMQNCTLSHLTRTGLKMIQVLGIQFLTIPIRQQALRAAR